MAASDKARPELLQEIRSLRRDLSALRKEAALLHERKQSEVALRESEERYRRLFEDDLTGDYVATPEGVILACNPAFAATLRFADRQEALEASMVTLFPDAREHAKFIELIRERGRVEYFECVRRRRDGALIHVVENAVGHFTERGELQQIRGYLFDNTAHKMAEQALRDAEKRHRSLIEFLPDAILVSDEESILFANPAAALLFGAERSEDLVGRRLLDLFHPDHQPAVSQRTQQALHALTPGSPAHRKIVRLDSRVLDVETAVTPIVYDGKSCVLRVNRDITARIQAEEELRQKDHEISFQFQKIEKLNTALTTLLEHREQEGRRQTESIRATLDKLILPYLESLQATRLDESQRILIEVLAANFANITSSFARQLDTWKAKLTPTEIQVADLIRLGKRTKDVAALLKVSPSAVAFHRTRIRAKLGLTRKPLNLVSSLRVLSQQDGSRERNSRKRSAGRPSGTALALMATGEGK